MCLFAAAACGAETPPEKPAKGASAPAQVEELDDTVSVEQETPSDDIVTHIVEIRDFKFVPETITVKAGERITWKNIDVVPHTATADDKRWDSGNLGNNATWSLIVQKTDEGGYFCLYHPVMKGRITVEE